MLFTFIDSEMMYPLVFVARDKERERRMESNKSPEAKHNLSAMTI